MDKLLLRGEQLTSVASRYSVSEDALGRHKKHMQVVIAKAAAPPLIPMTPIAT